MLQAKPQKISTSIFGHNTSTLLPWLCSYSPSGRIQYFLKDAPNQNEAKKWLWNSNK